jgi:hypothetical protein
MMLGSVPSWTPAIYEPNNIIPMTTRLKPVGEYSTADHADFEKTCFYITPIGDVDTEQRKHSDLILASIVEPALQSFELRVVRAVMRTIIIDTTTIYTLVPKLHAHHAEIANQVRRALENPEVADNPISMYYPNLKVALP